MNFEEMALRRQSCRDYDENKKVSSDILLKICEISANAPSSCNSQPWKMHIVNNDPKTIDNVRKSLQTFIPNKFLNEVNSFIAIEQKEGNMSSKIGARFTKNDMNSLDLGILISHITFACLDYNLDSCIIGGYKNEDVVKALKLKDNCVIRAVIAIGYAKENDPIRKKARKDKDQLIDVL